MTERQLEEARDRTIAGEPVKRLAREYGVAGASLLSLLWRRYGLRSKALRKFTEEEVDVLYLRALAGVPIRQLALEHGGSWTSIMRLLQRRFDYKATGRWQPTLTIPDDVAVRAYMAGLIDGEGSIPFLNNHWCVKIGMTDEPVIRWLYQFGGHLEIPDLSRQLKLDGTVRKQVYCWQVHRHRDVETVLRAVMPYLIVKRSRAEQVLAEFQEADIAS